jgi:hypothetical protein
VHVFFLPLSLPLWTLEAGTLSISLTVGAVCTLGYISFLGVLCSVYIQLLLCGCVGVLGYSCLPGLFSRAQESSTLQFRKSFLCCLNYSLLYVQFFCVCVPGSTKPTKYSRRVCLSPFYDIFLSSYNRAANVNNNNNNHLHGLV